MPVNDDYLRYYPSFDIKRALAFQVERRGGQVDEEIKLPSELVDASSILSNTLLAQADALIDYIDDTLAELRVCLKRDEFAGLTVDDYDRARAEGNIVKSDAFEDFHIADPNGKTQGEIYCLLGSIKERVERLREFVKEHIVPVKPQHPETLAEAEEKMYAELAYIEYTNPGSIDRLSLAYEAQLKYQVKQRLDYLTAVTNDSVSIAKRTLHDTCHGAAGAVGGEMASGEPDVLRGLRAVLGASFIRLTVKGLQLKEQDRLYGNQDMIQQLQKSAVSLAELRLNAVRKVTGWLKSVDIADENSPVYTLASRALDGINLVDSGLDTTILDLSKAQQMERMNLEERLENMRQRKEVRQLVKLTDTILSVVDFSQPVEERRRQGEMVAMVLASRSSGICAN